LDDDRRSRFHSVERFRDGSRINPNAIYGNDREPGSLKMLDVVALMSSATLCHYFQGGVRNIRLCQSSVRDGKIKACQVAAVKMPYQI
jgi:hypothetical protein